MLQQELSACSTKSSKKVGATIQPSQVEIRQSERLWYVEAQKMSDCKQLIKQGPQMEDR